MHKTQHTHTQSSSSGTEHHTKVAQVIPYLPQTEASQYYSQRDAGTANPERAQNCIHYNDTPSSRTALSPLVHLQENGRVTPPILPPETDELMDYMHDCGATVQVVPATHRS